MTRIAVVLAATLALSAVLPWRARAADANGPAAPAVSQWFSSDHSLGCFDTKGKDAACGPWNQPRMKIYYGGENNSDALVIGTYLTDPTSNGGENLGVAYFHQDGGAFHLVKVFKDVGGHGVVPGTTVKFAGNKVMLTMQTLRPTDSLCCLTGRTPMTLSLR